MRHRRFRKNNSNLILYLSAILILNYLLKNPEIIVAMVVTNSFFTPNAKTMASTCNVVLIDRNKLP
jgi:hypothetical protein